MDLLLSMTVSLPTSRRPICFGSIPYFSKREVAAVKLNNQDLSKLSCPHRQTSGKLNMPYERRKGCDYFTDSPKSW